MGTREFVPIVGRALRLPPADSMTVTLPTFSMASRVLAYAQRNFAAESTSMPTFDHKPGPGFSVTV